MAKWSPGDKPARDLSQHLPKHPGYLDCIEYLGLDPTEHYSDEQLFVAVVTKIGELEARYNRHVDTPRGI